MLCLSIDAHEMPFSFHLQEKLTDASTKPSSTVVRPNAPAYANTVAPTDYDDGISFKGC